MHVLTAPLLANTAHDKNSKGEFTQCWVFETSWLLLIILCRGISDVQEGSAKINPVCPGQWNVQSPVKTLNSQGLEYIHNSSLI